MHTTPIKTAGSAMQFDQLFMNHNCMQLVVVSIISDNDCPPEMFSHQKLAALNYDEYMTICLRQKRDKTHLRRLGDSSSDSDSDLACFLKAQTQE